MSEHSQNPPHSPASHGQEMGPGEHAHPQSGTYLRIATVLTVLTAIEVAIFYIPAMKPWLVPLLLFLSALKFALVAMFYMHLKFDSPLFTWLFVFPMAIAVAIIVALMLLFGAMSRFHTGI